MNQSQLAQAFGYLRQFGAIGDAATFVLDNMDFARVDVVSTGGVTRVLPDAGFVLLLHNASGAGTITVNDTDGNAVASVVDNETALCIRVGESTNKRWHANVLKMGAT
jgi:hypothetical protein